MFLSMFKKKNVFVRLTIYESLNGAQYECTKCLLNLLEINFIFIYDNILFRIKTKLNKIRETGKRTEQNELLNDFASRCEQN